MNKNNIDWIDGRHAEEQNLVVQFLAEVSCSCNIPTGRVAASENGNTLHSLADTSGAATDSGRIV